MTYIYDNRDWPNFRWDSPLIGPLLAKIRHQQGRLLGHMEALGFHLQDEANLTTLTVDVVNTSAIEGELLDAREVRSSLSRKLGMETGGTPPSSRNIEGVVEMMLNATQKYSEPLTRDRLFAWHASLFPTGYSNMRKISTATWRTPESGPMQVVSGGIGREHIHFQAPDANRLDEEVNAFLQWFNAPPAVDPVLKAALAHFWFVTIHPFEDGNGRISRAIADMALSRADESPARFYSMSAQIEAERKTYYQILETSQKGTLDITLWLTWFLECLGRALERAHTTLAGILRKAKIWDKINMTTIHARQRLVINRLLDGFEGNLTSSKYAKLAHCSTDTALRDIRELVECGTLLQNPSGGRSSSYRLCDP